MRTDGTTAYHQHFRRFYTRNAPQQDTASSEGFFQVFGTFLDGQASGYFRHRVQQGQATVGFFHRFVRQANASLLDHGVGQRFARSEVEIREDQLVFLYQGVLGFDGFLYLDDHLGLGVGILDGGEDRSSGFFIFPVADTAAHTGRVLYIHRVAVFHQLHYSGRRDGHPVLIVLDFFWNTDFHFFLIKIKLYSKVLFVHRNNKNFSEQPVFFFVFFPTVCFRP